MYRIMFSISVLLIVLLLTGRAKEDNGSQAKKTPGNIPGLASPGAAGTYHFSAGLCPF